MLLALAWNSAPDAAHCSVGNRRIMELTGLSDRAVRGALHALDAHGLVGINQRRDPCGARLPNLYSLRWACA
ncbi:MAG TPA: hypothetical protein PKE59_00110 [Novosphingobium sp.]|nr:hypothetical protein [Novosphingobium sp.]